MALCEGYHEGGFAKAWMLSNDIMVGLMRLSCPQILSMVRVLSEEHVCVFDNLHAFARGIPAACGHRANVMNDSYSTPSISPVMNYRRYVAG